MTDERAFSAMVRTTLAKALRDASREQPDLIFLSAYCGLGYDRPSECISSLCRERGCHNLKIVTARRKPYTPKKPEGKP